MQIPKQLQNKDFRFVKLGRWNHIIKKKGQKDLCKGKAPFEREWQTKNNYKYNDKKLLSHIERGFNFGVIGGYGNLRILDIDDPKLAKQLLTKISTYTVQTGSGGMHFYFISDYDKNHVLVDELGELRASSYQVVSAPCKHPSGNYYKVLIDKPIQKIKSDELYNLIKPYLREEVGSTLLQERNSNNKKTKEKDTSRSGLEYRRAVAEFRKGKTRSQVHKELLSYKKYADSAEEYQNITLDKAESFVLTEHEKDTTQVTRHIQPSKKLFNKGMTILKKYIDTSELNYILLNTWTLGTHFHNQFETYPLLTLMARKSSGKTRTLKLLSSLADKSDGSISTSITETFLFRHKEGALFFDEMESISSREKTALRETINSVYKKGNKIVRYTEKKTLNGKEYVEECFYPFYPLGIANIYGFGDVLSDRSLQIILQRSSKTQTKLIEDFSTNPEIIKFKEELSQLDVEIPTGVFTSWNNFIESGKVSSDFKNLFEEISKTKITGRPLEIFFPLFLIAEKFDVLDILIDASKEYMAQREGEFVDNVDDLLQNFMDQSDYSGFVSLSQLLGDFKGSLEEPEDWMNSKWFGRALKRLGLIQRKRLVNGRVQIELNNNTTNTTNTINTTNSTNTTKNPKKMVELGEFVELVESVDTNNIIKPEEFSG